MKKEAPPLVGGVVHTTDGIKRSGSLLQQAGSHPGLDPNIVPIAYIISKSPILTYNNPSPSSSNWNCLRLWNPTNQRY